MNRIFYIYFQHSLFAASPSAADRRDILSDYRIVLRNFRQAF